MLIKERVQKLQFDGSQISNINYLYIRMQSFTLPKVEIRKSAARYYDETASNL